MIVYRLRCDSDVFRAVYGRTPDETSHISNQPHGRLFRTNWKPPLYRFLKPGEESYNPKERDADFIGVGVSGVGLSAKLKSPVRAVFENYGELLPLDVEGDLNQVFWFHCVNVIDALDEKNSVVKRLESNGRIFSIEEYVFSKDKIGGDLLFQIPQSKLTLFCTDAFKNQIEADGLTGLSFAIEWSDEPETMRRIQEAIARNKIPWDKRPERRN